MSRFAGGYRSSADDLAYGDYPPAPQRWDRDRFEGFARGPPPPPEPPRGRFEEDYRYVERERPPPGVAVQERPYSRGPPARFADDRERDRIFQDTFYENRPRRRTDKELFGEVDPRELAQMALTPYKPREYDFDRQGPPPRPGMIRRQSSLDTFDRRPAGPRYDREEYRIPPYTPVPLPIRRPEHDHEHYHYRDHHPEHENYREVEIKRERSVHRRRGRAKSHKSKSSRAPSTKAPSTKAPSTVRSASVSSSSSSSTYEEASRASSSPEPETERRIGKKGKTRMPKRLVHRDALHDLAYPYDEEEDFFLLRIALDKDQIDEVIKISEMYKAGDKKTVYKFEDKVMEAPADAPPGGHEELIRKEYINPPSNWAPSTAHSHRSHHSRHSSHHSRSHSRRDPSPSVAPSRSRHLSPPRSERSHRTRGRSASEAVIQERKTVVEEEQAPAPPAPPQAPEFYEDRRTIIEERAPPSDHGALIIQERDHRSQRDIESEIRALEAERRALRLERESDEYQLVEYRDRRPEILPIIERNPSPQRNVVRVEKDRKGRMALVRSAH